MSPARIVPAVMAAAAMLGGCAAERAQLPAVVVPSELTGTWMESGTAPGGFLAIGQRSVTTSLAGGSGRTATVASCSAEPGIGAGEIVLGDGQRLLLASGAEPRERRIGDMRMVEMARFIDLTLDQPGRPPIRTRLWAASSTGISAMALMPSSPTTAAPTAPAVAAPTPAAPPRAAPTPDEALIAAVATRAADATALVERRKAGASASELSRLFGERQRSAWLSILTEIEARKSDEAARHHQEAAAFAAAVETWLGDRG